MADTPPPLPLEAPLGTPRALDEDRVAPPHAPLLWRTLAFLADAILLGMIACFVTTVWLMPLFKSAETAALNGWLDSIRDLIDPIRRASDAGNLPRVEELYAKMGELLSHPSDAALSALSFMAGATFLIHWIGFAAMEIATGGASVGKKMFRLRVVRFPHAEKTTALDSVARSFLKSMSVTPVGLLLIFAVVDAYWPLFNPLRRSLHDIFSRTIVLDARYDKPEDGKKKERRGDG